jgi:hypothetical protein
LPRLGIEIVFGIAQDKITALERSIEFAIQGKFTISDDGAVNIHVPHVARIQIYFLTFSILKITLDGIFALGICAQG